MAHAIGIDLGTTNAKVVLAADDGTVVASATCSLPTHRDGDIVEQDFDAAWYAVGDAIAMLTARHSAEAGDVVAVGVCSQYSSIVPVDTAGVPVAPMALWQDKRGTDHSWAIAGQDGAFELWIERHGIPPVGNGLSLAHILHFQHDRPDVHARTAAYLEPMDALCARFTGRIVANQATMLTAQLCDNRSLGATAYDRELLGRSGVDGSRLPPLAAFDAPVGPLLPDVAVRLGLPAGAIVQAAMNDSHADVIATGARRSGRAGLAVGTTTVLVDTTDHHAVDLDHEVLAMPSPLGTYLVWAENGIGGRALEVVVEQLLHQGFADLESTLAASPAGANGVLGHPWLNGSLSPRGDSHVRGGFLNIGFDTSPADLVRGMAEGVAHNLAWLIPVVEEFTGRSIDDLVFVGGGARSAGWCQIFADVTGKPVSPAREPAAAVARATALQALHRHGALTADDLDDLVETTATYEPDATVRQLYDDRQAQFVASFEALRPIYAQLNRGQR